MEGRYLRYPPDSTDVSCSWTPRWLSARYSPFAILFTTRRRPPTMPDSRTGCYLPPLPQPHPLPATPPRAVVHLGILPVYGRLPAYISLHTLRLSGRPLPAGPLPCRTCRITHLPLPRRAFPAARAAPKPPLHFVLDVRVLRIALYGLNAGSRL